MSASTCDDGSMRTLVGILVLGRLSEAERHAVSAHLRECATCRAERAEIDTTVALLGLLTAGDRRGMVADFGIRTLAAARATPGDQLFGAPGVPRPAPELPARPAARPADQRHPVGDRPGDDRLEDDRPADSRRPAGEPQSAKKRQPADEPRPVKKRQPADEPRPVNKVKAADEPRPVKKRQRTAGQRPADERRPVEVPPSLDPSDLRPEPGIGPWSTVDLYRIRLGEGFLPPRPATGPLSRGPHSHRRPRSRRPRAGAVLGLTGLIAVTVSAALLLEPRAGADSPGPVVGVAATADGASGAELSAVLYDDDGQVSVQVSADGLPPDGSYQLWAVTAGGEDLLLGRLSGEPGGGAYTGDVAVAVDDLWYLSVRQVDGPVMVRADVVKGSPNPGRGPDPE